MPVTDIYGYVSKIVGGESVHRRCVCDETDGFVKTLLSEINFVNIMS